MKKLTILILAAAMFAGCVQEQKKETGKTEAEAPAKKQKALAPKGMLLISGFYQEDIPMLEEQANKLGLYLKERRFEEKWAMLLFESDAFGRTNI